MSGIVASPTIREVFREIESAVTTETLDGSTVKLGAQFAIKLAAEQADKAAQPAMQVTVTPDTDGAPTPVSFLGDEVIPTGGGAGHGEFAPAFDVGAILSVVDAPITQRFG